MRMQGVLALTLAVAAAGAQATQADYFTPDEAVLACMARADHEMARRHGSAARPAGPFETVRMQEGWRVHGAYLVGEGDVERLRVACDITGGRVDLVTEPAAE